MSDKMELWLPKSYKSRQPVDKPLTVEKNLREEDKQAYDQSGKIAAAQIEHGKEDHRNMGLSLKAVYKRTGLPGKTLWDILQLLGVLAIPVVVVIASSLFSVQLNQENLRASEQQHETDIQISTDQQRETVLHNYIDIISGLLLNDNLLRSKPGDAVREVAHFQTITALLNLNSDRKAFLLSFLYEENLIGRVQYNKGNVPPIHMQEIVLLRDADLSGIDLGGIDLGGIDLSGANLSGAKLIDVNLTFANLSFTNLSFANLSHSQLNSAMLNYAQLNGANLKTTFALAQSQLDVVSSCQSAILPLDLTCHPNAGQSPPPLPTNSPSAATKTIVT